MTSGTWSDAAVRDIVARTTAAQGLPHHLEDPVAIAKVATLLDRSPAVASTFPGPVSAGRAGSVDGAAGPCAPTQPASGPAASSQTDNRPGTLTPRAAYRPNVLGQKQV